MADRRTLTIKASDACEHLGIALIGLVVTFVNRAELTWIGHDYFVSEVFEQPADPGRVGACFKNYSRTFVFSAESFEFRFAV